MTDEQIGNASEPLVDLTEVDLACLLSSDNPHIKSALHRVRVEDTDQNYAAFANTP